MYVEAYGRRTMPLASKRCVDGTGCLRMFSHTRATVRCSVLPLVWQRAAYPRQNLPALAIVTIPISGYAGMTTVAVIGRQEIPLCSGAPTRVTGRAIAQRA